MLILRSKIEMQEAKGLSPQWERGRVGEEFDCHLSWLTVCTCGLVSRQFLDQGIYKGWFGILPHPTQEWTIWMLVHWKSESDKNVIFPLKSFYRALKSIDKDSKNIIWSFGEMCEVYSNIHVRVILTLLGAVYFWQIEYKRCKNG